MTKFTMDMLNTFIQTSRTQTQSEILKTFLRLIVFRGGLAESGSVCIWNKSDRKLHLFNDDDFLFIEGFLDKNKNWKLEFDPWEGLAGQAFQIGRTQYSDDVTKDRRFAVAGGGEPIRDMVCVPIVVRSLSAPFGVASFHNSPSSELVLDEQARTTSEVAVNTLGLALDLSASRLATQSVFIVHGHDMAALNALQTVLLKRGVSTLTLADQPRTGEPLLQKLDEVVNTCSAGFVLLTPDDLGRLASDKDETLKPRARQNVVFEGGLLFGRFGGHRMCYLLTDPELDRPSDIQGILYESFDANNPNASRIEDILTNWGIKWGRPTT
jgi:predicted nucleotide-binding protein